jgi:hypothetical protein
MPSLADLPEVVGFFSYSRDDDLDSKGNLSALRDRIQRELRGRLGRTKANFRLWQDTAAIPEGALWEDEIQLAITQSQFFIPIITPTTIRSRHCKREFELFLGREAALGRRNLIFPLLYIRVPELEDEQLWKQDEVLRIIGDRQYLDWQDRRYLDVNSPEVAAGIGRFCNNIYDALRQPGASSRDSRTSVVSSLEQPRPFEFPQSRNPAAAQRADAAAAGTARGATRLRTLLQYGFVALAAALVVAAVTLWPRSLPIAPIPATGTSGGPAQAPPPTVVAVAPTPSPAVSAAPVPVAPAAPPPVAIAVPAPKTVTPDQSNLIRRSAAFGGSGGDPFDDSDANPGRVAISAISAVINLNPADHNQRIIGSLQTRWGNTSSQPHGGKGPFAQQTAPIVFGNDERIVKIFILHKLFNWARNEAPPDWIAGMQIHTNKGFYNLGDTVGPADICVAANDESVIGFFGRAGSYIDQIGCIFAKSK